MKKSFALIFIIFTLIWVTQNNTLAQEREGHAMTGLTIMPSFSGPGLGIRSWSSSSFGWGLEALSSWNFSDFFIGRARLMFTISTSGNHRWYALLTGGYMALKAETGYQTINFSSPSVAAGLGYEWLWGMRKNWGFSIEAGYQYSDGKYSYTATDIRFNYQTNQFETYTYPASGDMNLLPVYVGASLAYYF